MDNNKLLFCTRRMDDNLLVFSVHRFSTLIQYMYTLEFTVVVLSLHFFTVPTTLTAVKIMFYTKLLVTQDWNTDNVQNCFVYTEKKLRSMYILYSGPPLM